MTTRPTATEVLLTPLNSTKFGAPTIGRFLAENMTLIWGTLSFTSKLPSGNALWESEVIKALIREKHLTGTLDGQGYLETYDKEEYEAIMLSVFDLLQNADYSTLALPPEPKGWFTVKVVIKDTLHPYLEDYLAVGMTEKAAKLKAEEYNEADCSKNWFALKLEP